MKIAIVGSRNITNLELREYIPEDVRGFIDEKGLYR